MKTKTTLSMIGMTLATWLVKNTLVISMLALAIVAITAPADATTIFCNTAWRICTATLSGTGSPNHLTISVSDAMVRVSMCDVITGSCVWRSCTVTDDGSQRYKNVVQIALQGENFNAMNYGQFVMAWDADGKCSAVGLNG